MKQALIFPALLALAACNNAATTTDDAAPADTGVDATMADAEPTTGAGFEAVAPGDYEVRHSDGSIDRLEIHPGMTWSMVYANGDAAGGTIFAQDGKNCFVTEGVEGHQCYSGTSPAADGSIEVTGEDGDVVTVTPVDAALSRPA